MKVSKVSRNRISDIIVSRNTVIHSIDSVNGTTAVFSIENNTADRSNNFFLSKEAFYDNMEQLHRTSASSEDRFTQDKLPGKTNPPFDQTNDSILSFVQKTVEKFNETIDYIQQSDHLPQQLIVERIIHTVTAHNRPLSNLGILIGRNHHIQVDADKFLTTATKSPHHLRLLLDPEKGILRKIHDSFSEVIS